MKGTANDRTYNTYHFPPPLDGKCGSAQLEPTSFPSLTLCSGSPSNVDRVILCTGKANIPSCRNRNLHGPASGVLWPTPSSVLEVGKELHALPAPLGTGSPTEIFTGIHASALGSVCSLPLSCVPLLLVFQYAAFNVLLPTQMLLQSGGWGQSDSAELSSSFKLHSSVCVI